MDTTKAVTDLLITILSMKVRKAGGLAVGIKGTDTAKTVQSPGKEVLWANTAATKIFLLKPHYIKRCSGQLLGL